MKRNAIITREEMLEQIENFRLMDDDFMSRVFDDNNECTELVLRIILEKDDLIVKKVRAQYEIKNLRGVRYGWMCSPSTAPANDTTSRFSAGMWARTLSVPATTAV